MRKYRKRVWGILLSLALIIQLLPVQTAPAEILAAEETETVSVTAPTFSKESGNYETPFNLELTADEGMTIYYSTDGSIPSPERFAENDSNIYEYTGAIPLKDRTGAANVLATSENAAKMTQTKPYTATDSQVAKSNVIRAMAVDADGNCSEVVTKSYFVGKTLTTSYKDVAVLSLVTDPKNLMDDEIGIFVKGNGTDEDTWNYTQHGQEWERQTFADFYEPDGTIGFSSNIGIRTHGGYTRQYQQKSMNVYFREEYGPKNLKYELIPGATNYEGTKTTNKYKSFVLRNGGNDTFLTKTRDVFIQSLVADRNMATQSYRPCVVYLNGEYWGLYNIQEKYGDNWLEEEFGVDKDNVVLIKDNEIDEGTDADMPLYEELKALGTLDMSQPENYQKFLDAVDLQSYLDYYATEILIGNRDWGFIKNNQFWRSREITENKYEDGKWRWLLHDTEFSMSLYGIESEDSIDLLNNSDQIEKQDPLFATLLENSEFRTAFVNTAMDLLNENFNYEKQSSKFTQITDFYATLMDEQNKRFGTDWGDNTMSCFNSSVADFNEAWQNMNTRVTDMLKKHLSVKTTASLSVSSNIPQADSIQINTLNENVAQEAWTGTYFKEAPVQISAPAVEGYDFVKWDVTGASADNVNASTTCLTLTDANVSAQAVYKPKSESLPTPTPAVTPEPATQPETPPSGTEQPSLTTPVPTAAPSVSVSKQKVKVPKKPVIKKLKSVRKKTINVQIKKMSAADGFEILYARNRKFTKNKKKITTKKTSRIIKKLKRKKTYYVKVRAYRFNAKKKKIYGKYSSIKKVKVK